jgi:two-component system NarL family sensor kinase
MFSKNQELYISLITGFILILFVAFVFILSIIRYRRKTLIHANEKQQLQLAFQQALLQTQLEIQEQTLKTISEEIHDNVGQVLSLAKLNLNTLDNANDQKIQDTKNLVSKAINDLRNLSRSLHGDRIAELGLLQSITDELNILQNSGQFATHLKVMGNVYKMELQKEMVLFRIVQEAMNNAIKHSEAKNITVQMDYQPQLFCIIISDDGTGFDAEALAGGKAGIGLTSMKNRIALIGGNIEMNSILNNGTTICITLAKEIT